ncbi:MAG: IcmT/TraK family protein [Legionellaceae bacterium]|nr:IcmT/TraK family protein [Legionellaceae bacterium]
MADFSADVHWRDAARHPRFFMVDARAAFPMLLFLLHIRLWTAGLVVLTIVFFGVLEHYGFSVPVFLRWLRSFIAGPVKSSQPWWH